MNNLGALYEEIGRFRDGEQLMRFAEESRRRILGDDHPGTLDSIGCLGLLLSRMERHEDAEPLLREAAEGSRRVLGGSHPDTCPGSPGAVKHPSRFPQYIIFQQMALLYGGAGRLLAAKNGGFRQ
jgi:hypothetical protein